MDTKAVSIQVLKADDTKKIIYGIVLKPDIADAHGDIMEAVEVEKSAHNYLMFYRNAGVDHSDQAEAKIVESYIAPSDLVLQGRAVAKGSWVVAMKVFDENLWLRVKQGDYNAFSAGGYAKRENKNN